MYKGRHGAAPTYEIEDFGLELFTVDFFQYFSQSPKTFGLIFFLKFFLEGWGVNLVEAHTAGFLDSDFQVGDGFEFAGKAHIGQEDGIGWDGGVFQAGVDAHNQGQVGGGFSQGDVACGFDDDVFIGEALFASFFQDGDQGLEVFFPDAFANP